MTCGSYLILKFQVCCLVAFRSSEAWLSRWRSGHSVLIGASGANGVSVLSSWTGHCRADDVFVTMWKEAGTHVEVNKPLT